jgi:DNA-binding CsgD family transcriptional regulator
MFDDVPNDLVGRSEERETLRRLVAGAMSGHGGATVVAGPDGIGKTALLGTAARTAETDGVVVVRAVGTEAEQDWPYAGLNQLYSAIAGALARDDARWNEPCIPRSDEGVSAYEVALRAQDVVDRVDSPTLVVVDDAHLLDVPSKDVIGFVARRLGSVPVALVLAVREAIVESPAFAGIPTVRLSDLPEDDAADLVRRATGGRIVNDAVAHVTAGVGGNPRALLDVVRHLPEEQRTGQTPTSRYLPHSSGLRAMVMPELDSLKDVERFALLVAAASKDGQFAPLVAALGGPGADMVSWLAHRYLTVLDGSFTFRHAMVGSIIWQAAELEERSRAHHLLAAAYTDTDPDYELWHRAQATHGYDGPLADDLHRAASRIRARGELQRSAALARQSVRLAGDTVDRADRLILSGQLALYAGRIGDAARFAREGGQFAADPRQLADLAHVEAQASNLEDGRVPVGLITSQALDVAAVDPNRAARLLLLAARQSTERLEIEAGRRFLDDADRHQADFDATTRNLDHAIRAWLSALEGERDPAVMPEEVHAAAGDGDFDSAHVSLCRAQALVHTERFEEARTVLDVIVRDRRYGSSPPLLASARVLLADLEQRSGNIMAAVDAALTAERAMDREWGPTGRLCGGLVRTYGLLGQYDKAWTRRDQAFAAAQRTGDWATIALAQAGAGLLLLLRGEYEKAVAVLARARYSAARCDNPAVLMIEPDLIEACVRHGDLDQADGYLQDLARRTQTRPSAWGRTVLARSRALVAEGDGSLPLFLQAIDACAECASPVELGRTMLCYGERLRALGHASEAATWLHRAVVVFRECGASALVACAERELQESYAVTPTPAIASHTALTAAEQKVATMAASGLRNREIAAQLYVSARTVEGHLSQVFRKLGVRSRTELASVAHRVPRPRRHDATGSDDAGPT